jgi:hypothetical protein
MIKLNKKANSEWVLSPWMFLIFFAVLGALFIGGVIFYGVTFEVRFKESQIMISKTIDCLIEGSVFKKNIFNNFFNFSEECYFDSQVLDKSGLFFLKANITDSSKKEIKSWKYGDSSLYIVRGIKFGEESPVLCSEDSIKVLHNKEVHTLQIIACSINKGVKI